MLCLLLQCSNPFLLLSTIRGPLSSRPAKSSGEPTLLLLSDCSMLAFVSPQVPTTAAPPPDGSEWIHEIKHDGFRTMLVSTSTFTLSACQLIGAFDERNAG